jgi:hypothetical protein
MSADRRRIIQDIFWTFDNSVNPWTPHVEFRATSAAHRMPERWVREGVTAAIVRDLERPFDQREALCKARGVVGDVEWTCVEEALETRVFGDPRSLSRGHRVCVSHVP